LKKSKGFTQTYVLNTFFDEIKAFQADVRLEYIRMGSVNACHFQEISVFQADIRLEYIRRIS